MRVTIYHNPSVATACGRGTSRDALDILRAQGIEPVRSGPPKAADEVVQRTISSDERRELGRAAIEYLKTPLTRSHLQALIVRMGVPAKDVVRWKEKDTVAEAGISEGSSDDALLDAMAAHPILMNRPIVVTDGGAKLCRPAEMTASLL